MGTFGIDFDMGPLKGGSRDDLDSCRLSFDTVEMTGESLMRRLFEFCFLHFSRWHAPLWARWSSRRAMAWSRLLELELGPYFMGIRSDGSGNIDCLQGGGRHIFFLDFFPVFFAESQFQIKKTSQYPPPPCNRGAFNRAHSLRIFLSSWLPTSFTCQY